MSMYQPDPDRLSTDKTSGAPMPSPFDEGDFTRDVRKLVAQNERVPEQRKSNGLTHQQDASLDALAEAIAAHIKEPCSEPEPCVFHRALVSVPSERMTG